MAERELAMDTLRVVLRALVWQHEHAPMWARRLGLIKGARPDMATGPNAADRADGGANIATRALLAIAGGYAVTWVLAYWLAKLMPLADTEAVIVSSLLGLLIYPVLMVWAFSCPRTIRVFATFAVICAAGWIPIVSGAALW